jgi:hypothetical protein
MKMIEKVIFAGAGAGIGYAIWRAFGAQDAQADKQSDSRSLLSKIGATLWKWNPWMEPTAPLFEPRHPHRGKRINRSGTDTMGAVRDWPTMLLHQARQFDPGITLDELAAARWLASEHPGSSFTEQAAIIDVALNRADKSGKSLFESVTRDGTFGPREAGKRPVSTSQDPSMSHVLAARAVLSGKSRGIARGATYVFSPEKTDALNGAFAQWAANGRQGEEPHSSGGALAHLDAWSFCTGQDTGSHAWVGAISGIDPWRVMLMRPRAIGFWHRSTWAASRGWAWSWPRGFWPAGCSRVTRRHSGSSPPSRRFFLYP